MKAWRIVPALPEHIPHIAAHMREADRREVWASHRHTPEEALAASLERSDLAWTGIISGQPAVMWGAGRKGSLITLTGSPWLLATPALEAMHKTFLGQCKSYVTKMQARFPRLENYVHAENRISQRWLRWCDFSIEKSLVLFNGEPFLLFWRDAHV